MQIPARITAHKLCSLDNSSKLLLFEASTRNSEMPVSISQRWSRILWRKQRRLGYYFCSANNFCSKNCFVFFPVRKTATRGDKYIMYLRRIYLVMDARSASVHVIFCRCFFIFFFIPALVGQTAERIFTKLSHVVDIRHHLRTY